MDSQQIRNLQEAYIGVYDSDLREEQEFKSWVTELLDEGYDLSDYTWNEMYEIYNEARDPGVKEYKGGARYSLATIVRKSNKVKPAGKKPEGETGGVGQVKPDGKDPLDTNKSDYVQFSLGRAPRTKRFGRPFGREYSDAAIRNDAITSQMAKPKPEAPRRGVIKASYESDIYDVILEYLINEGYADTYEAAESIMVNMSEDWRESIVEARVDAGKTDDQKIDARNRRRDGDEYVDSAKFSPLPGVRGDSESDREIDHLSSRGKKKPVASSPTRQTKRFVEEKKPLPYKKMMKKSDELALSDNKNKQERAAKIYIAANDPKNN